ncbi:MAG: hypothetical protein KC425_22180, partial [Anaerolineales bacterium]|nr:hypothetical protein [Anaerolineales bacterium]
QSDGSQTCRSGKVTGSFGGTRQVENIFLTVTIPRIELQRPPGKAQYFGDIGVELAGRFLCHHCLPL